MPKLFSYVVHHDLGFAPHPFGGFCTLAKCKFGDKNKRNIVELADEGDWIVGTGGADLTKSAGHGTLVYAMRVDDKIPLAEYCSAMEGKRIDADSKGIEGDRYALISRHFYYFGRNAIDVSEMPQKHLDHPFEKKGPGHRSDFNEDFIEQFVGWLESTFKTGVHGPPCQPHSALSTPKCASKVRRSSCTG